MTLHWWMHWFWVTAQIVVSLQMTSCLGATSGTSQTTGVAVASSPAVPATRTQYETTETLARLQQSYRIAKAVGIEPTATTTATTTSAATDSPPVNDEGPRSSAAPAPATDDRTSTLPGRIPGKKETKITWVHAFSKPPRLKTSSPAPPPPPTADEELLTVMPLREREAGASSSKKALLDPNAIRREQLQLPPANRSSGEAAVTAAPVLEAGLQVDSTRLGRARGTFTSSEFQQQREQLARDQRNKEEAIKETATGANGAASVTEIATITGSCLAIIILLSTLGSLAFIVYRRRYLNPPQTLNSDKCSNPDSSGYIDDSTIRDNSEEMYSLDNDSFLNSLEAMTIQNYWTDSVKHTKL